MNMDDAGEALLDCMLRTAEGELTAAELLAIASSA
jgi:(2R)-sulfolactate sulfo-lyase subunit beta